MANNKQAKKKERERRLAKEKIVAAAKKRAQVKTTEDSQKTDSNKTKFTNTTLIKSGQVSVSKKTNFTQRRSGG